MKIRHMKKRHYAAFKRHRAFLWSTQRVMNVIAKASMKMSAAMEAAYAKSRQSTLDEAEAERIMIDIWRPVNGFGFVIKEQE